MPFSSLFKKILIDVFALFSFAIALLLFINEMIPFISSAVALHYLNAQNISYIAYTVLLILFPIVIILHGLRHKRRILSSLLFIFAAIVLVGTIADLISYKGFIGYEYSEGEAVFVNTMWNMPSLFGAIFSLIISGLYIAMGIMVKKRRRITLYLMLAFVILASLTPFIYTALTSGFLPRLTWLEKALFIIPAHICTLISFSIAASSRGLWIEHIWR